MQLQALMQEFRIRRDDTTKPYDWSDEEVVSYINEAITEACERAWLIEDSTTPEVCRITLRADKAIYELHPSVIKVKRVTFDGRAIDETSTEAMDMLAPEWEEETDTTPRAFILANDQGIRPYPIPSESGGVLNLTVYRNPIDPMSLTRPKAEPEIHERHQLRMLHWAYRCAMLKRDSVTYNPEAAAAEEALFARSFGLLPDANVRRKHRDRRPPLVRSAW